MSTKWKYATLPASERLDLVRNGNKDVYDSEISRSLDVINSRKALGLDISDQKKWIDSLGHNYNLYNAGNMSIPANRVNATGYADRLLGEGTSTSKVKSNTQRTKSSNTTRIMSDYLDEFYAKLAEASGKRKNVKEWLLNNGIDENSDTGKMYLEEFDDELAKLAEKYKAEYISKVNSLMKK